MIPILHKPLRPGDWRGEFASDRPYAPFASTWSATLDLLSSEVQKLGGAEAYLQVDVGENGIRLDGSLRAGAKAGHPGVILTFRSKHGPLRYQCDKFAGAPRGAREGWQCNARALGLGLQDLRRVERYGIAQGGEQYAGFGQLPAARPMPAAMTVDEAMRLMGIPLDDASRADVVTARFRLLARTTHPDVGGDSEAFRRLAEARDLLIGMTR